MSISRQDAWTLDEDLILAEVVLRNIREGGTQLTAFEEVGTKLNRTAAACGFRWNSVVRKQYKPGIDLAKKQRKEMKQKPFVSNLEVQHEEVPTSVDSPNPLQLEDVLAFIVALQKNASSLPQNGGQLQALQKQLMYLQEENKILKNEVRELSKKLLMTEEDYRELIGVIDTASKLIITDRQIGKA